MIELHDVCNNEVHGTGKLVPDIWMDCVEDFQLSRQLNCSLLAEDWSLVRSTRVLLTTAVTLRIDP